MALHSNHFVAPGYRCNSDQQFSMSLHIVLQVHSADDCSWLVLLYPPGSLTDGLVLLFLLFIYVLICLNIFRVEWWVMLTCMCQWEEGS